MLGGSYTIFWKIYLENPFYNKVIAKLWSILVAINLWTILLLTFSKFLEVRYNYHHLGGSLFRHSIRLAGGTCATHNCSN